MWIALYGFNTSKLRNHAYRVEVNTSQERFLRQKINSKIIEATFQTSAEKSGPRTLFNLLKTAMRYIHSLFRIMYTKHTLNGKHSSCTLLTPRVAPNSTRFSPNFLQHSSPMKRTTSRIPPARPHSWMQ